MEQASGPLIQVCRLLNSQNAEYLVVGAWAMILNSVVRRHNYRSGDFFTSAQMKERLSL